MHTGETLVVLAAMILLSAFTLSLNSSFVHNNEMLYQSEQILDALAVAQNFIEQAEALRFDEDKVATIPTSFTYAGNLGPDSGEQYPNFDDIDDFHGFASCDTSSGHIDYTINVLVHIF